jgi:hypothetical protein
VNNKDDKKFSIAPVEGDSLFLQYIEPNNGEDKSRGRIKVHKLVYGFKKSGFEGTGAEASGKCNVDVACAEGRRWVSNFFFSYFFYLIEGSN